MIRLRYVRAAYVPSGGDMATASVPGALLRFQSVRVAEHWILGSFLASLGALPVCRVQHRASDTCAHAREVQSGPAVGPCIVLLKRKPY